MEASLFFVRYDHRARIEYWQRKYYAATPSMIFAYDLSMSTPGWLFGKTQEWVGTNLDARLSMERNRWIMQEVKFERL